MLFTTFGPLILVVGAYYGWNQKRLNKAQHWLVVGALSVLVVGAVTLTHFAVPRNEQLWMVWPLVLYAIVVFPTMLLRYLTQKRSVIPDVD